MSSVSVMVVDDVPLMRGLLINTLRMLNVTNIHEASDATSALNIFIQDRIDIVFLDINMPDVDGLTLMKRLQAIDPLVFIVMVSGESSLSNVKESIALGAKGFIVKPYTSGRIDNMIKKYNEEQPIDLSE